MTFLKRCQLHGSGTRKRVREGKKKDPIVAGCEAGRKNLKHGLYSRRLLVYANGAELGEDFEKMVDDVRQEGAKYDREIALMRWLLERLISDAPQMGGLTPVLIRELREAAEGISRVLRAKAQTEQGIKIDWSGAIVPILERVGELVREALEKFVPDPDARSGFDAYFRTGLAERVGQLHSAGLPALAAALGDRVKD